MSMTRPNTAGTNAPVPATASGRSGETLPEFWPADPAPEVSRPWWIPWPMAIVLVPLLWLRPARMGPHFAAVRWPGVIIGQVFWTIYGAGCIALALINPHVGWVAWLTGSTTPGQEPAIWPEPTLSEVFRSPLALLAWWLVEFVENSVETYLLTLAGLVGAELVLMALGVLLMPFAAVGGRRRHLLARSVKLTLWSLSSVVVLGLAVQAIELTAADPGTRKLLWVLAVAVYVAWFLWIGLRSVRGYPGPPVEEELLRRRPLCEKCGYVLTGLTAGDRCPECGGPVAESMPQRRRPMPFLTARGLRDCLGAYLGSLKRIVLRRGAHRDLAVFVGLPRARSFGVMSCVFGGFAGAIAGCLLSLLLFGWGTMREEFGPLGVTVAVVVCGVGVTVMLLLIVSLTGASGVALPLRGSPYRPAAVTSRARLSAVFQHAASMLPTGLVAAIAMPAVLIIVTRQPPPDDLLYSTDIPRAWETIMATSVIGGTLLVPLIPLLVIRDVVRIWWHTRFANA